MSSQTIRPTPAPAKSPILAAVGISLAIGLGALLGTADPATVEDAITASGSRAPSRTRSRPTWSQSRRWSTASAAYRATSISWPRVPVLRSGAARIRLSSGLAKLDAEIAALKDTISGIQNARLSAPRTSSPNALSANADDVIGLRSTLHDLAAAHHGSVAALTKRLDRIEVMVGSQPTSPRRSPIRWP